MSKLQERKQKIEANFSQISKAIEERQAVINKNQEEIVQLSAEANRLQGEFRLVTELIKEAEEVQLVEQIESKETVETALDE